MDVTRPSLLGFCALQDRNWSSFPLDPLGAAMESDYVDEHIYLSVNSLMDELIRLLLFPSSVSIGT